jgi:hypothetical protein
MSHRYLFVVAWLFGCGSEGATDPRERAGTDVVVVGGSTAVDTPVPDGEMVAEGGESPSKPPAVGGGGALPAATPQGGATFQQTCRAGAQTSCETCLCTECLDPLERCAATSGCAEITACIRDTRCAGITCYCGQFDAVTCLNGQADGPCKATILAAPGGRAPTLVDPSGGPASDAALAIGECGQPGKSCAAACSEPG